jgi:GDP-L-fucose synthase
MSRLPDAYGVPSRAYDLRKSDHVEALFKHTGKVDILFHLAARIGGIGANRKQPGQFFYDNMLMGLNVIHRSMLHNVGKIIMVGTTCSYPCDCYIPFLESNLFEGYPEITNASYGIAKRALLTMLQAYHQQYGLKFIYLIPTNLYGPGDDFNPETSHVIPALIRKCLEAKKNNLPHIQVWGSGRVSRDFVYVEDVADALVLAMDYEDTKPINLGSGKEVFIDTLVNIIKRATGYEGQIIWDTTKPDGQPRRCLNTDRAREWLKWEATTDLQIGLSRMIKWYQNDRFN